MNFIHAVNNIDSPAYRPRWIEPALHEASRDHPVVVLTGALQVGKSTLLHHAVPFRDWRYRSLDDLYVLAQARDDPVGLWAGADAIVLDEVQRAPGGVAGGWDATTTVQPRCGPVARPRPGRHPNRSSLHGSPCM